MTIAPRPAPTMSALLRGKQLPALDGLRAVAVFVVILDHAGIANVRGDLGVSAFFVLSGFLITWLLLKEFEASGRVSLRSFYTRRVLRIFPAYYVFITLSFAADYILKDRWTLGRFAAAFGYMMNYYNAVMGHPTSSIAHAWSLAIEEQFYLLWPAAFVFLVPRGRKALVRALVLTILAIVAWRSWLYLGRGVGSAWVYNAFDCRFDNLAIGCLLAVIFADRSLADRSRVVAFSPYIPILTVLLIVYSRMSPSSYHYSIGFTIDALLIAVFLVQMLWLHTHPLWAWLQNGVVRYLGRISYPLYLYHIWALGAGKHAAAVIPLPSWVWGIGFSVLMASASYYIIEKPFLRLKARFERV